MKDSRILSTFQETPGRQRPGAGHNRQHALVFDACRIGVVLRAVLFVEATRD